MVKSFKAAQLLAPFFNALIARDFSEVEKIRSQIVKLEHQADDIKRQLGLSLSKNLFLPVARTDILELISAQDRIPNKAKDIAGLTYGRKMIIPDEIQEDMLIFLDSSIRTAEQASKAISQLDELLETSFKGKLVEIVEAMIVELDEIENESDRYQVTVRQELFKLEEQLKPIDALFLYQLIEWIGDLSDRAQYVGGRLQLLLAR